jgi:hypothetical protein
MWSQPHAVKLKETSQFFGLIQPIQKENKEIFSDHLAAVNIVKLKTFRACSVYSKGKIFPAVSFPSFLSLLA